MIVALPKLSTVLIFLTITPSFINRHDPKAMKVVNATGISSGELTLRV
jgi:hypothetical protein